MSSLTPETKRDIRVRDNKRQLSLQKDDPLWVRGVLIGFTVLFFILFVGMPLVLVFSEACNKGIEVFVQSMTDPIAAAAIQLTLTVALIAVPLNALFGIAVAWLLTKFDFKGKPFLTSLLDLPLAVSPVVAGLIFVLLIGSRTPVGHALSDMGIKIIFSTPGIVIATTFVTFPFVARELIPLMQAQGRDLEEAGVSLGASGWQIFRRVTLPSIRWGLAYGLVLCNARAIGEFGAVSVVSGHIRGETDTMPLHIEILYSEYDFTAAFAVSSLLVFFAFLTILARVAVEYRYAKEGLRLKEYRA